MGRQLDRREFLWRAGSGVVLVPALAWQERRPPPRPDLDAMARRLLAADRDAAMAEALGFLREGATPHDVLGACFLAGVREVKPRPVGFKLHCVMMVESASQMVEATAHDNKLLPVLFAVDDLKRSQAVDEREGDWSLAPLPEQKPMQRKAAEAELRAAMTDWDAEKADRAIASLARTHDLDELFELLWPFGARSFHDIGHFAIFTAHVYRSLARIGRGWAVDPLRSLVFGLLTDGPGPDTKSYEDNVRRLGEEPPARHGYEDPEDSVALLEALRGAADAEAASTAAVAAMAKGVMPRALWDGMRLLAAELMVASPSIITLHATTVTNALAFACSRSQSPRTRALLLLQAAAWVVNFRNTLQGAARDRLRKGPGIETWKVAPGQAVPERAGEVFAAESRRQAATLAFAFAQHPARRGPLCEAMRERVFRKGSEHHMYKYAAAVIEDTALCHPRWAPHLLAASMHWLPGDAVPDAEVYERARAALAKLQQ